MTAAPAIRLDVTPRVAPGASSRVVDGVAVAITEGDQTLHTFQGPVATFIWGELDGQQTLSTILARVLDTFEVERGQALDDLVQFVQELQTRGLVTF